MEQDDRVRGRISPVQIVHPQSVRVGMPLAGQLNSVEVDACECCHVRQVGALVIHTFSLAQPASNVSNEMLCALPRRMCLAARTTIACPMARGLEAVNEIGRRPG